MSHARDTMSWATTDSDADGAPGRRRSRRNPHRPPCRALPPRLQQRELGRVRRDPVAGNIPGGDGTGGEVVAEGTPEEVGKIKRSHTGQYLAKMLN